MKKTLSIAASFLLLLNATFPALSIAQTDEASLAGAGAISQITDTSMSSIGNAITVTANINLSADVANATAICAFYAKNGKMLDCDTQNAANDREMVFSSTVGNVDSAKIFLLGSYAFVPLCGYVEPAKDNGANKPQEPETPSSETEIPLAEAAYIGNSGTMKFHYPDCRDVPKIKSENITGLSSREEAVEEGYSPCGHCKP